MGNSISQRTRIAGIGIRSLFSRMPASSPSRSSPGMRSPLSGLNKEEKEKRIPGKLPPSHSEISKDHPGHMVKGANTTKSLFFEIHELLAIEADKHILFLVEQAWQEKTPGSSVIPDRPTSADTAKIVGLDMDAAKIAQSEMAASIGKREFAQLSVGSPSLIRVLNAVDLYISHPADSNWWKSIVNDYIKSNTAQVKQEIERRNKTMGERK